MITIEQTASDLFDKIRNRFSNLEIGDEEGKSCSENPERARFFNFDFIVDGANYGNITISIADTKSVKVFYDRSIDRALGPEEKKIWFSWLRDMREFARSHFKEWDVRDIAKSGLNLNDLKFLRRDTDSVRKNEVKTTEVAESKLYGTSRSSYQKLENVRIIARHSKPIVDETIPGARSRNIESFYIENSQGERFKLPEGTTINGARAYARHVKNGGELHDDFSRHIGQMIKEMADLRMFVRNMRGRTFEDIETQQMVESAIDHYGKLHSNVHMLRSQRGYDQYKSLWQPEVLEESDIDITALRERFVKKIFDDRITDALPVVFREYNKRKMAVEQEFESWASTIVKEFEENPIDKENKKQAREEQDLEEDEIGVNVKGPFANSMRAERDSEGNMINGDNEEEKLASLLNSKQFEFRFEDGVYYFESNSEIKRARAWIAKTFPKMRFPKMGLYDYGYGVYGSTTFDRELPNGKGVMEGINEDLRKWFKEKWVRFGPDGKIRGDCARGDDSEGKPKCLPRAKAHALGKKGRKTAASRKRREDPNPERSGPAINVKTKESQHSHLSEFAPSSGEGNGPFDYGRAIVEIGQEFVDYYQDEGAQADAKAIIKVGQTFISAGMKAGIQAFYNLDTQIRDHIAEQLMEQGFNVKQDIYLPYRQQMDKEIANDTAEREKYISSPEYAARRADDLTISAIPDKPINSWSKPGDPASSVTMDRASKRNIKAEFEKFKQDLARRDSLKGVPLRFEITVGGKPVDINSLKEQGVAEDFTDDLDNIYAMHPQPEKSEQVVFLITGMTEDEFSNRWTDLPDPYQQEFGHDLPLWDADDLSSYPNLAVKRITFDQYVQLVGNYIKSEELTGSTMSRMKQSLAEGSLEEVDRREFLKGLGAATFAGATGRTFAQPTNYSWQGEFLVPDTLEKNVKYIITNVKKNGDIFLVKSKRLGPSGESTTIRAINCIEGIWKYTEEDGIKSLNSNWSNRFFPGSSADRIFKAVCSGRFDPRVQAARKQAARERERVQQMLNNLPGGGKEELRKNELERMQADRSRKFPWWDEAEKERLKTQPDPSSRWIKPDPSSRPISDKDATVKKLNVIPEYKKNSTPTKEDIIENSESEIAAPYINEFGDSNKQGMTEGDFDKWGGEIKTPPANWKKNLKQPTSPAKLAKQQAANRQRQQQKVAESPVQWHNTETGVKDAAQTDHTMDEALEYLKTNYPVVKMYNVRRAAMGLSALDQPKYFDTGDEADINKNIIRNSAAHMSGVDSAVDYLQLRKNTMMSGSQQVTLTIGYSWSVYENPNNGIAMLYYQDRGMAWDEIYLAGKTPKIQAQARQVFRDAGVLPTPIKKTKQQGVAEGKHSCPECGGRLVEFRQLTEKKDACYYKVKSRYKVWPSAYASGALVKCRKKGAKNWGNKSESKLTPAAKLLDSFKEDLDKF